MKVTHKYNHWFLRYVFRWARAMTLGNTIIYKYPRNQISDQTHAHEMVHVEQIRREGLLKFYIKYLWYNLRYGYKKNPYEVEARRKSEQGN